VIDAHRDEYGVEPICRVLEVAPSTYYAVKARRRNPSDRALRDAELTERIRRVHAENYGVYGARKVWWQLQREGVTVARCTVERLMAKDGLQGAVRGKKRRTTIPDEQADRAPDLVDRDFSASAPNRLWVSDFTYVATWSGTVYVAFAIDVFSRRIVGWKADTSMKTDLVLDTLEMAIWARDHHGQPVADGLIVHSDAGSQYTSFAFTQRLIDAGADPSIGSVGDAYDNALAESTIGLYKTELIRQRGPWKTIDQVELSTPRMGRLVQQPTTTRSVRPAPASRIRANQGNTDDSITNASTKPGAVHLPVGAAQPRRIEPGDRHRQRLELDRRHPTQAVRRLGALLATGKTVHKRPVGMLALGKIRHPHRVTESLVDCLL